MVLSLFHKDSTIVCILKGGHDEAYFEKLKHKAVRICPMTRCLGGDLRMELAARFTSWGHPLLKLPESTQRSYHNCRCYCSSSLPFPLENSEMNSLISIYCYKKGRYGGLVVKNPLADAGDKIVMGLNPGSGRSPGGRSDSPLHYSCLENSMYRGAWWGATAHGVTRSQTQLSTAQYASLS